MAKKKASTSIPSPRKPAAKTVARKKYTYSNARLVSKRTFERYLMEEGLSRKEAKELVELSWQ